MPRLARLRLVSVGRPQARFNDLTLSFRDPNHGRATDAVLWLRNAGGKSSLLSLFFALLRPHKQDFLGASEHRHDTQRKLSDYVLADDRSVVVAEWEMDASDTPLLDRADVAPGHYLTGVFYEWSGAGAGAGGSRLDKLFFASRVVPEEPRLTLEGFPLHKTLRDGGKARLSMTEFKQEWNDLGRNTAWETKETETQTTWAKILDTPRLDPALFGYQVRMNRQEVGVADEFRFRDDEAFVDYFLRLVLEPEDYQEAANNVVRFREVLKDRSERLLPELELTQGLVDRLEPLAAVATARKATRGRLAAAANEARELAAWLERRRLEAKAEISTAEHDANQAGEAVKSSRHVAGTHRLRAFGLRLRAARERERQAGETAAAAEAHEREARSERALWEAAVPLREALNHAGQARAHAAQLARRHEENRPLLEDLEKAASRFAAALRAGAEAKRNEEKVLDAQVEDAHQRATAALALAAEKKAAVAVFNEQIKQLGKQLEAARHAFRQLETRGVLAAGELVANAVDRLTQEITTAEAEMARSKAEAERWREEVEQVREEESDARQHEVDTRREEAALREEEAAAQRERQRLEISPQLLSALELEELDLDTLDETSALQLMRQREQEEMTRWFESRAAVAEDDRVIASLEETGLLPPRRDVNAIRQTLTEGSVPSWSGWEYLKEVGYDAEKIRTLLAHAPEFVQGVVVPDEDAFANAKEALDVALNSGQLRLDGPVTVIPPTSVLAVVDGEVAVPVAPMHVVGPTGDAHFDPDAGRRERIRRTQQATEGRAQADRLHGELEGLRALRADLRRFRESHPRGWFTETARRRQALDARLMAIGQRQTALAAEAANCLAQVAEREAERETWQQARTRAVDHRALAQAHLATHGADPAAREAELAQAEAGAAEARHDEETQREAARNAEAQAKAPQSLAKAAGEDARGLEDRLARVRHLPGPRPAPRPGDLPPLEQTYLGLEAQYQDRLGADGLNILKEQAELYEKQARERLTPLLQGGLTEAIIRSALDALPHLGEVETRRRDTEQAWEKSRDAALRAVMERDKAVERRKDLENQGRRDNLLPSRQEGFEELLPADAEAVADAEERAADGQEAEAARQESEANAARVRATSAGERQRRFQGVTDRVQTLHDSYGALLESAYTASPPVPWHAPAEEQVESRVTVLREALRDLQRDDQRHDHDRQMALEGIFRWMREPRFQTVPRNFPKQIEADPAALEREADAWREAGDVRVNILKGKLAEEDKHREILVHSILYAAERGVDRLKDAAKASKLPASLPTLGGRRFLEISHGTPEDSAHRHARITDYVDDLVRGGEVPSGLGLVQEAVRRLARPVRVRVLFPDPDLPPRLVPVAEIALQSDGERITCAVLLYCTLAQARARRRGLGLRPSGVLLLDNPVGEASRAKFLQLQVAVAGALGVQLIYTTGVNDLEALGTLPVVIRLRNERQDRRTNHQHVEHVTGDATPATGVEAARLIFPAKD